MQRLAAAVNRLADRYNAAVTARPFVTTSTVGFVIASLGDVACQVGFAPEEQGFDARRTLDMGLIRAFVMAPLLQASAARGRASGDVASAWLPTRVPSEAPAPATTRGG